MDTVGNFGTCIKQSWLYHADLGIEQYDLVCVSCKGVGYCTLVTIMSLFQQSQQRQLQYKRKRNVQMHISYEIENGKNMCVNCDTSPNYKVHTAMTRNPDINTVCSMRDYNTIFLYLI